MYAGLWASMCAEECGVNSVQVLIHGPAVIGHKSTAEALHEIALRPSKWCKDRVWVIDSGER